MNFSVRNNSEPLISVLLPVYNTGSYIRESIESILGQSYTNFELLVLDDSSTDNTRDIVRSFYDNRIELLTESENRGIVYQLNKGLKHARGVYVARMDADDISLPNRFRIQVDYLVANPHIDILGSQAEMIGGQSGITKYPTNPKCIDYLLNYYCPLLHPTVMIKGDVFKSRGHMYQSIPYAEDYKLWVDISNGNNISNLQDVLLKYRIHKGQTNQIRFNEQYYGSILARSFKIQKTFCGTSRNFQLLFNHLANDYIFYGTIKASILDDIKISLLDLLLLKYNYLRRYSCKKPIVDFVYSSLIK